MSDSQAAAAAPRTQLPTEPPPLNLPSLCRGLAVATIVLRQTRRCPKGTTPPLPRPFPAPLLRRFPPPLHRSATTVLKDERATTHRGYSVAVAWDLQPASTDWPSRADHIQLPPCMQARARPPQPRSVSGSRGFAHAREEFPRAERSIKQVHSHREERFADRLGREELLNERSG